MDRIRMQLKFDKKHLLLLLVCFVFLLFLSFLPLIMNDHSLKLIICSVVLLPASVLCLAGVFYSNVFKMTYLEINNEGIIAHLMFKKRIMLWNEILSVQEYTINNNTCIGLTSKEIIKRENTLTNFFNSFFGGDYKISFAKHLISEENLRKLYEIIDQKMTSLNENAEFLKDKDCEIITSSDIRANIYLVISTIVFSVLYLLALIVFNTNFLLFIFLQACAGFFIVFKYSKSGFNIGNRIFISLSLSLTVVLAHLVNLEYYNFVSNHVIFNVNNIIEIAKLFFIALVTKLDKTYVIDILILIGPILGIFVFKNKKISA